MEDFWDILPIGQIGRLIENITALGKTLISMFAEVFGWLGPGILTAIGIGISIAIILRIFGR